MHNGVWGEQAKLQDLLGWLPLAREVEPLVGPMGEERDFRRTLRFAIEAGHAFRIRQPECPVQTFAPSVTVGRPARRLYTSLGFRDTRPGGENPGGLPTVIAIRDPVHS